MQSGTAEVEERIFLPGKFLLARKNAAGSPTIREIKTEQSACEKVNAITLVSAIEDKSLNAVEMIMGKKDAPKGRRKNKTRKKSMAMPASASTASAKRNPFTLSQKEV